MKLEKLVGERFKERPADCVIDSHAIMVKGGYIKYMANGIYSSYLPLRRIVRKIEQILREEMDKIDGQEVQFPVVMPASLWDESGRYDSIGDELLRFTDRNNAKMVLGMTHEEAAVHLVREYAQSYTKYPFMIYQIQTKFRDEARPRAGLIRVREFTMKDAYSFDKDEAGLDKSYKDMYDAYTNIFNRCGLTFRPVEADGGAIGNATTHEFTVLAETGESDIVYCEKCDYAANAEKSELKPIVAPAEEELPLEKVNTPGTKTIEAVAEFLNTPIEKNIKAVIFQNEKDQVICAFVRGDHEVNDVKLQNITGAITLKMAEESAIRTIGGVPGFMSPIGLSKDAIVVVDATVMEMHNAVCGANEEDCHYKNANPKRDFGDVIVADIRLIAEEDPCPHCGAPVKMTHGIEVGQVFKLGIKYSKALGATFLDENGKEKPLIMGCYGIGVSRTMAAAIEQFHDDNGIIWPASIAPFEVVIVPINAKDEAQMQIAEKLYADMKNVGIDVLLDDRKDRAGVKFKDADLIGYPVRITVSPKLLDANEVEIKVRRDGATSNVKVDDCAQTVKDMLKNL